MTDTVYWIYECWNKLHFQFHTQFRANGNIVVFDSSTVVKHHIHTPIALYLANIIMEVRPRKNSQRIEHSLFVEKKTFPRNQMTAAGNAIVCRWIKPFAGSRLQNLWPIYRIIVIVVWPSNVAIVADVLSVIGEINKNRNTITAPASCAFLIIMSVYPSADKKNRLRACGWRLNISDQHVHSAHTHTCLVFRLLEQKLLDGGGRAGERQDIHTFLP